MEQLVMNMSSELPKAKTKTDKKAQTFEQYFF